MDKAEAVAVVGVVFAVDERDGLDGIALGAVPAVDGDAAGLLAEAQRADDIFFVPGNERSLAAAIAMGLDELLVPHKIGV